MCGSTLKLFLLSVLLVPQSYWISASGQTPLDSHLPKTTAQRLKDKGWWPTKTDASREDYVGAASCAACHKQKVITQQETSMAHAASRAIETEVLRLNPNLSFSTPPFQTVISSNRTGSDYTVSGRGDSMSGQVFWSMGAGVKGQTFILRYLGMLFESQVSYFPSIGALDITPEHPRDTPEYLERAFGAPQTTKAARQCFACHTTASSVRGRFDPDHATPGVTCEACHGPGAQHVKAMRTKKISLGLNAILDPSSFGPLDVVDFCGACHRAPMDVAAARDFGPLNIRFQPYRLSKSRCWSRPDPRLTCVACHNPHEPLVRDPDSYDAQCDACHSHLARVADTSPGTRRDSHSGNPLTCPVSNEHCVSCHMPKYNDPQFHGSFTDHDIRVVHPGDPYPR
jgi:hypothetical protein